MKQSIYNSRKFNLVPPKTKEEVLIIEERDNTLYYSFILIFFGMVIFFVITLAEVLVIQPRQALVRETINNTEKEISSYNSIRRVHGELFTKSRTLEPILDQDIKLTQLLQISQDLISGLPSAQILSYSREQTGDFVVELQLSDFRDMETITNNASEIEVLENLFIRSLSKSAISPGNYSFVGRISFKITNIPSLSDAG